MTGKSLMGFNINPQQREFVIHGPPEKQELPIPYERALEEFNQMYRIANYKVKHALSSEIDKAIAKYKKANKSRQNT